MEKEIEDGEYVRTILGNITKVVAVKDTVIWTDDFIDGFGKYHEGIIKTTDIVKHSSNIIDLIEVGDYVNGEQITDIWNGNRVSSVKSNFSEEDIYSIATKEQFASMEYKVKE